jgi:nitrogen-specific signal transduction histidine kinase
LGLAIVHRAIEEHRGHVFVESNSRGTRFTVVLPAWRPTPPKPESRQPSLVQPTTPAHSLQGMQ